ALPATHHDAAHIVPHRSVTTGFDPVSHPPPAVAQRPPAFPTRRSSDLDANENRTAALLLGLADGKVHGKGRAVRAQPNDFAADTDDLGFAGVEEVGDVAVMFTAIRFRHQHLAVFATGLAAGFPEHFFTP